MRGFRVNRTAKTGLAFDVARRLAERVKELGWHVQFLLDVEDHPDLDTLLGSFATEVVIDHMGRPDPRKGVDAPGFQALIRLLKSGRGWAKMSAPYRTSLLAPPYADITPFAHALVEAAPDRLVWGSDWPHVLLETDDAERRRSGRSDRGLGAGRGGAQAHPGRQRRAALRLRAGVPPSLWRDRRKLSKLSQPDDATEGAMKKLLVAAVLLAVGFTGALAQTYPDRPIKVLVPYPAGGPTDTVARCDHAGLTTDLGQSVIVENQAGAGGRLAMKTVARAAPDGYTLLLGGTNNNGITPAVYKDLDFDAAKDFAPVAAIATDSLVLVVNPNVPAKTLAELVAYAKANPGKLSTGGGIGISPHFILEFVRVKSGTNMQFVPYRGAAPAMTDTISGQIQIHASAKVPLLPQIQSGKLRALAVASASAGRSCRTCRP